jgi:hypothetical protein
MELVGDGMKRACAQRRREREQAEREGKRKEGKKPKREQRGSGG